MKIAFFGTPEFAWNILSWILEYPEVEVCLVVSQPDKAVWRKRELFSTPVKQVALDANIEVIQPQYLSRTLSSHERDLAAEEFHDYLKSLDLDFIVVVAYGKIIPQTILDIPKQGCVNIHGSILPKYRGASPVQAAVRDGLTETWLTTMYMSAGMDEWDILKIAKVDIDNVDTSVDIFKKFVQIWPELLVSTLREIISWDLKWTAQDDSEATHCGKISREEGEVFFSQQSVQEIYNTYRAYTPWPGIYTWHEGKRLVLEEVSIYTSILNSFSCEEKEATKSVALSLLSGENWERCSWKFIKLSKNKYGIVCVDKKILEIHRVKLEGKKSMDVMSFVNGNREVVWYQF